MIKVTLSIYCTTTGEVNLKMIQDHVKALLTETIVTTDGEDGSIKFDYRIQPWPLITEWKEVPEIC
jgi:hypothetical protein